MILFTTVILRLVDSSEISWKIPVNIDSRTSSIAYNTFGVHIFSDLLHWFDVLVVPVNIDKRKENDDALFQKALKGGKLSSDDFFSDIFDQLQGVGLPGMHLAVNQDGFSICKLSNMPVFDSFY